MAEKKKNKKIKNKPKYHIFSKGGSVDGTFLFLLLAILGIGLLMLFSASYANAYYYHKNSFHYILRQSIFAVGGIIAMFMVSKFDYRILKNFSNIVLIISILLLILVFTQKELNNAKRWIFIGEDLLTFQPSEIAKLAVAIYFAKYMTDNEDKMGDFKKGVFPLLVLTGVYSILLILEPHLSATIIVICIAGIMMFIGGTKVSHLFMLGGSLALGFPLAVFALGKWDRLMTRVNYWLNPFSAAQDEGYQVIQSLYAIGSGGLMGVGIGDSKQKYLYLPEPQNDFIFSIICEEIGFVGATLLLALFVVFVWRGFSIGLKCKDRFGSLLCIGIISQVGIQVIFNVAVVTNTIPNTGISLPFFSYGGTSLMMLLAQMGIILSISRENNIEDKEE